MTAMTTAAAPAAKPMFDHAVPEAEPPIGTVASFHYSFASGSGSATGFMMRGPSGWSDGPDPQPHNIRTWQSLADLEFRNAEIQQRRPGSTAVFVAIEVRIHATPPVDRDDTARLAKLEHAISCAAERAGIHTEGASHTELAVALANLVFVRSA